MMDGARHLQESPLMSFQKLALLGRGACVCGYDLGIIKSELMACCALDRKLVDRYAASTLNAMFTDDEKALLEHAFQVRERQTEEERAQMRAEFQRKWPALVAYIKKAEADGKKMSGAVLFTLGEAKDGPTLENIVWYLLDRAVIHTKRAA